MALGERSSVKTNDGVFLPAPSLNDWSAVEVIAFLAVDKRIDEVAIRFGESKKILIFSALRTALQNPTSLPENKVLLKYRSYGKNLDIVVTTAQLQKLLLDCNISPLQ